MKIVSRTDENVFWYGTVTLVDYESPSQGNDNDYYFGGMIDSMTSASKYPFYVELDSSEGLLLGQHVYIQIAVTVTDPTVPYIPESYLMDILYDDDLYTHIELIGSKKNLEKVLENISFL